MPPKKIALAKAKGTKTSSKDTPVVKKPTTLKKKTKKALDEQLKEVDEQVEEAKEKIRAKKKVEEPESEPETEDSKEEILEDDDSDEEDLGDFKKYRSKDGTITHKFEPDVWIPNFPLNEAVRVAHIGNSKSGKSFALKWFLQHRLLNSGPGGFFQFVIIVTENVKEMINYSNICRAFGIPFKTQKAWQVGDRKIIKKAAEARMAEGKEPNNILIIIDDFQPGSMSGTPPKDTPTGEILALYCSGRHYYASIWIQAQYPTMIGHIARANCNLAFINQSRNITAQESVIENILRGSVKMPPGCTKAKETRFYKSLMGTYAGKLGDMLVVDTREDEVKANKSGKDIFKFRAPPPEEWTPLPPIPEDEDDE